jgi:excisionase family DNA binding protein
MKLDRDWYKDANEEADIELQTQSALKRVFEDRAAKIRSGVAREKKRIQAQRATPVRVGKMHPPSYWAEILGFSPRIVSEWAHKGEIKALKIKGEWRISESAIQDFLDRQQKAYVG